MIGDQVVIVGRRVDKPLLWSDGHSFLLTCQPRSPPTERRVSNDMVVCLRHQPQVGHRRSWCITFRENQRLNGWQIFFSPIRCRRRIRTPDRRQGFAPWP